MVWWNWISILSFKIICRLPSSLNVEKSRVETSTGTKKISERRVGDASRQHPCIHHSHHHSTPHPTGQQQAQQPRRTPEAASSRGHTLPRDIPTHRQSRHSFSQPHSLHGHQRHQPEPSKSIPQEQSTATLCPLTAPSKAFQSTAVNNRTRRRGKQRVVPREPRLEGRLRWLWWTHMIIQFRRKYV